MKQPPLNADADADADAAVLACRPRLARRARVRFDPVRNASVLLLPESVLVLTRTAAEVLALCDGERTLAAITDALAARYPAAPVRTEVLALVARLRERGLLDG